MHHNIIAKIDTSVYSLASIPFSLLLEVTTTLLKVMFIILMHIFHIYIYVNT